MRIQYMQIQQQIKRLYMIKILLKKNISFTKTTALWLLCLMLIVDMGNSTKFILQSCPSESQQYGIEQQRIQVPEIHEHPFSCELVFFVVYNYRFIVNVTQIDQNVQTVNLAAWAMGQTLQYNKTNNVNNTTAVFYINFQSMNQTQNFQMIMNFNLSLKKSEDSAQIQQRKAYILFSDKPQESYTFRLPTLTILLTTLIGIAIILILPWNIQYRKYLPISYNLLTCFVYILLLVVALYLQLIFGYGSIVFTVQRVIIGIFQFICILMYTQDLAMIFIQRTRVCLAVGLTFAIIVLTLDNFVPEVQDAWFLNDIIAIMIAGAFIKFVIIRKMKTAIWALLLMWIFCLFRQFAKQMHIQKFDQGFGIRVLPIFVQLPTNWIDGHSSLSCSAFGSSKIISFGIILNFCKRIDIYLSTQFYRILISIIAVICLIGQLIFNIYEKDLPIIEVMSVLLFYPLSIATMLFFANKRGEWAEIWDGSFYDMAVHRPSIQRQICFDGFQQQFGKEWIINSSADSKFQSTVGKQKQKNRKRTTIIQKNRH